MLPTAALLLLSSLSASPLAGLYDAVNAYRVANGLSPCVMDSRLELAAELQAKWTVYAHRKQIDYPDHFTLTTWARQQYPSLAYSSLLVKYGTMPQWLGPTDRALVCGYVGTCSEVGAFLSGNSKPADYIYAWDRSPGHKAILLGDWQAMGLCKVSLAGNAVVYVDFGRQ